MSAGEPQARLFVAVVPPPGVVELVAGLPREERRGVRWTRPEQWHVTLRFLGKAPIEEARRALERVDALAPVATIGPETRRLGRGVLCLPVTGLDALAASVATAFDQVGSHEEMRPYRGHLTLARAGQGARRPFAGLVGVPLEATFPVGEAHLIRSDTAPDGARYEVVASVPLASLA